MRDLIRTAEGEISGAEFRRGAWFLGLLTLAALAILYAISVLSRSMEWMTVVVAPFFGMVILFVVCSLIYFWYCIFTKRMRAMRQPLLLVNAWLASMFMASALRLVAYQNQTLALAETGVLAYFGFASLVFSLISIFLFFVVIFRGWQKE